VYESVKERVNNLVFPFMYVQTVSVDQFNRSVKILQAKIFSVVMSNFANSFILIMHSRVVKLNGRRIFKCSLAEVASGSKRIQYKHSSQKLEKCRISSQSYEKSGKCQF
jgi:hypothetical protein